MRFVWGAIGLFAVYAIIYYLIILTFFVFFLFLLGIAVIYFVLEWIFGKDSNVPAISIFVFVPIAVIYAFISGIQANLERQKIEKQRIEIANVEFQKEQAEKEERLKAERDELDACRSRRQNLEQEIKALPRLRKTSHDLCEHYERAIDLHESYLAIARNCPSNFELATGFLIGQSKRDLPKWLEVRRLCI